jgi:hypothetical protein
MKHRRLAYPRVLDLAIVMVTTDSTCQLSVTVDMGLALVPYVLDGYRGRRRKFST